MTTGTVLAEAWLGPRFRGGELLTGCHMTLTEMKDAALGKALQVAINSRIHFGTVRSLTLDSVKKTVDLQIALHGEPDEVRVSLHDYRIENDGPIWVVTIGSISSSREWVERAAQQFAARPRFTIPPEFGWVVDKLL